MNEEKGFWKVRLLKDPLMDPHTYLLSIRRKLKVSSFSNEKSVKKKKCRENRRD